jgi:hypothetical protein
VSRSVPRVMFGVSRERHVAATRLTVLAEQGFPARRRKWHAGTRALPRTRTRPEIKRLLAARARRVLADLCGKSLRIACQAWTASAATCQLAWV